jgi:phage terminase small subunit
VKITEKQRKFVDYYLETGNAEESAKRAGYSARGNTSKLLQNTTILSYLEQRRKEIESKRIMGAQEALETLTLIARGELEEEVVLSTPQGVERTRKRADINQRQKAIDSLLKRYPVNKHDELKNNLLEVQIQKAKAETDKIKDADNDQPIEIRIKRAGEDND